MLIFRSVTKINFSQIVQNRQAATGATQPLLKNIGPRNKSKHLPESFLEPNIRLCSVSGRRSMSNTSVAKGMNRLCLEKSPYLLQHANNPVDWYPWGEEAFNVAKNEDKPIFLSVGYSTCHWCHVMEKESFENEEVAKIMNEYFVNIKVDREERPDVDKMYMSYIQALEGHGGWPMSVFLTPTLEPIAGATYLPPEERYGRIGFKTFLLNIAKAWRDHRKELLADGKNAVEILKKFQIFNRDNLDTPDESCWIKCALQLIKNYDGPTGGFTSAPKFPRPTIFNFLFHFYGLESASERGILCRDMALNTLKRMAYGGIHDHVNNGFARYSVDSRWHVPHFEKMLYDQAQLVISYCDAYVITKDDFYADVARDILTYVDRDLSHPLGGFYGAEDADSYPYEGAPEKKEGAFCVWEYTEIATILSDHATDGIKHFELFSHHYNVKREGNVNPKQDPHGELTNKNVLACFDSYESTAHQFSTNVETVKMILQQCHQLLNTERQKRPKPDTDFKIVTSWNGLMISAFAKTGFVLKEEAYIQRAIKAAQFLRKYSYNEHDGIAFRCCYRNDGVDNGDEIVQRSVPMEGFLDDYAFLIRGVLDLYETTYDDSWLQWAKQLQEKQVEKFWDSTCGGFFNSPSNDSSILIRVKDDQDGAEPCGNSVSVHNMIRLAFYGSALEWQDKAGEVLRYFSSQLKVVPSALPEMLSGLILYQKTPVKIFIVGDSDNPSTQAFLDIIRSKWVPGRLVIVVPNKTAKQLVDTYQQTGEVQMSPVTTVADKVLCYICANYACHAPIERAEELFEKLDLILKDN